jgi:uncharacterized protein (TIGR02597 family)
VTGNIITLQPPVSLTADEFEYVSGTQSNTYYVQFLTGNKEGMYYTVTDNDSSNLTVNLNGDTLQGNVAVGDVLQVIPYWSLNTLFPSGQGINPSSSFSSLQRNSVIFLSDTTDPGINLGPAASYYYYNGTANVGPGWRQVGGNISALQNDAVMYPDIYFIVRNSIPGNTTLTLLGGVPMSAYSTPLTTLAANTTQDIPIGVSVPVPVTLAGSDLTTSGAFEESSSFGSTQRNDILFVYGTPSTINPAPVASYYYYNGTASGGAGWRLVGGNLSVIQDNNEIFQPGQAYIIRKKATLSAQTVIWSFVPSYLTQ